MKLLIMYFFQPPIIHLSQIQIPFRLVTIYFEVISGKFNVMGNPYELKYSPKWFIS
jgi:hypothetical protein